MQKTILITGATDGIGFETAKMLVAKGHNILLHGRNREKLEAVESELSVLAGGGRVEGYLVDLSRMGDVVKLAETISSKYQRLDVLINNAGVFVVPEKHTDDGLDVRFAVNTIAPYLLTLKLLPLLGASARVINLSSAAQVSVDVEMLAGRVTAGSDGVAYAQSKLALTMWSRDMALSVGEDGPAIIAVNPKSFLGSKMVKEAYGSNGSDLRIGAEILFRASLSDEFAHASGRYFDNDIGQFTLPHPDAVDPVKCREVVATIDSTLANIIQ